MAKRFPIIEACIIEDNILIIHKADISVLDVLKYAEKKGVAGLDFSNRILFVKDIEDLCNGLRANTNLIYLSLSNCHVTDWGVTKLCIVLKEDIGLSELCLDRNQITSAGAAALGYSLISNTQLYLLDLESNEIGDDGVFSFLSSIRKNETLGAVHFRDNPLTKAGKTALRQIDDIITATRASDEADSEDLYFSSQEEDENTPPRLELCGEDYDY